MIPRPRSNVDLLTRKEGNMPPIAYRPKDAATALGVSKSTIYEMIANGDLDARKIGAATVIPHEALARLLHAAPMTPAATKAAQASIK
jgi:excisionase family DNA binding protein